MTLSDDLLIKLIDKLNEITGLATHLNSRVDILFSAQRASKEDIEEIRKEVINLSKEVSNMVIHVTEIRADQNVLDQKFERTVEKKFDYLKARKLLIIGGIITIVTTAVGKFLIG